MLGHDLEAMHARRHGGIPFDPDAYLPISEIAAAVRATPGWTVEIEDKRPRPPGSATADHHVDDVVLRVRRAT